MVALNTPWDETSESCSVVYVEGRKKLLEGLTALLERAKSSRLASSAQTGIGWPERTTRVLRALRSRFSPAGAAGKTGAR